MQVFSLRFFDVLFSFLGLIVFSPVLAIISIVGYFDTKSPFFFQVRVGRNKSAFTLVKFRTMHVSTASVASHLASSASITKTGKFLRKTKLDELPQLWNVLLGDMSLVGARPCLFNQEELIKKRDDFGVFDFRPGITGLSQVNNIDMSTPAKLAASDKEMLDNLTVGKYFSYIVMTVLGKGAGDIIKD